MNVTLPKINFLSLGKLHPIPGQSGVKSPRPIPPTQAKAEDHPRSKAFNDVRWKLYEYTVPNFSIISILPPFFHCPLFHSIAQVVTPRAPLRNPLHANVHLRVKPNQQQNQRWCWVKRELWYYAPTSWQIKTGERERNMEKEEEWIFAC